jgi:hypothetical protein
MADRNPYRIYLTDDVIKKLDQAAAKTGEKSGNVIAGDIVTRFLPHWMAAHEAFDSVVDDFLEEILAKRKQGRTRK